MIYWTVPTLKTDQKAKSGQTPTAWNTVITNAHDLPQKSEKQTQVHIDRPLSCPEFHLQNPTESSSHVTPTTQGQIVNNIIKICIDF